MRHDPDPRGRHRLATSRRADSAVRVLAAFAALLLVVTASACAIGYRAQYEIRSAGVARTPSPADSTYLPSVEQIELEGGPVLRVEDDRAVFEWAISPDRLSFRITNTGSELLTVLMDSVNFIDPDGEAHRVGPIFTSPDMPRVIPPGKREAYWVFPSDYAKKHLALFPGPVRHRVAETAEQIVDEYEDHLGKTFRIHVPVRVGEVRYEYEFAMVVSEIRPFIKRARF